MYIEAFLVPRHLAYGSWNNFEHYGASTLAGWHIGDTPDDIATAQRGTGR
jgi:hypothetical protein